MNSKNNCDQIAIQDIKLGDPFIKEIDPFSIDYIRDQIEWIIRPFVHRNITMSEWLRINALTYGIVEKSLPSYLDNMAMLHQLQIQLEDSATHRYLITPFGERTSAWK